jgi:signal transduction histidine kinase
LRAGIDEAATELRRLVHNVMPARRCARGLVAAVEELVDRAEVPALLSADVDESRVSSAAAHTAYFVIAELLTNAVKHAGATALGERRPPRGPPDGHRGGRRRR